MFSSFLSFFKVLLSVFSLTALPYQPKLNQSFPESTPQAETQTNKGVLTVAAAVGSPSILLLALVICTIVAAYLWKRRKSRREVPFKKEDDPLSKDRYT